MFPLIVERSQTPLTLYCLRHSLWLCIQIPRLNKAFGPIYSEGLLLLTSASVICGMNWVVLAMESPVKAWMDGWLASQLGLHPNSFPDKTAPNGGVGQWCWCLIFVLQLHGTKPSCESGPPSGKCKWENTSLALHFRESWVFRSSRICGHTLASTISALLCLLSYC